MGVIRKYGRERFLAPIRVFRALFFLSALSLLVGFCLFPIGWQFLTALKPTAELVTLPPFLPSTLTLDHFATVFVERSFVRILFNSVVVASGATLLCLLLGAPAAFALTKLHIPARRPILLGILSVSMFPPIAVIGALFFLIRFLFLRDTLWALIVVDTAFALPLTVWVLTNFFREVPDDLLRAARVDGCTLWQTLAYVFLPVITPGLVTTALLVFVFTWNEFLFALTFTATEAARTAPVEILLFPGVHEVPWGEMAAAAMIVTLPILLIVFLVQRRLVAGLTAGAIKG